MADRLTPLEAQLVAEARCGGLHGSRVAEVHPDLHSSAAPVLRSLLERGHLRRGHYAPTFSQLALANMGGRSSSGYDAHNRKAAEAIGLVYEHSDTCAERWVYYLGPAQAPPPDDQAADVRKWYWRERPSLATLKAAAPYYGCPGAPAEVVAAYEELIKIAEASEKV